MKALLPLLVALTLGSPAEGGSITLTPANLQAIISGLVVGRVYTFTLVGCQTTHHCTIEETAEVENATETPGETTTTQDVMPGQETLTPPANALEVSGTFAGSTSFTLGPQTTVLATAPTLLIDVGTWVWDCEFLIIEWDDPEDPQQTPVPEPSTLLLIGGGLVWARWKRR